MTASLVFTHTDSSAAVERQILSFSFIKEAYTPYTRLHAEFAVSGVTDTSAVMEVMFFLDGRVIHHGIIDSLTVTEKGGCRIGTLSSRSFSCMLTQNQMQPGLYTQVSINRLMDNMLSIPYVTHENSADETGYIYVKYGSTMWEALAGLAFKQLGKYPYIRGTNCVMFSPEPSPGVFDIPGSDILSVGSEVKEKLLVSDLHMEDINGSYGTFDLNDADVSARRIVRHRYFELDKQFLYDPQKALEYRDKLACRGWRRIFCSYSGYSGEDISDLVSFGTVSSERITAVRITGSRRGVITELSVYRDRFGTINS